VEGGVTDPCLGYAGCSYSVLSADLTLLFALARDRMPPLISAQRTYWEVHLEFRSLEASVRYDNLISRINSIYRNKQKIVAHYA